MIGKPPMLRLPDYSDALESLRPDAKYNVWDSNDITSIEWLDKEQQCPSQEEILTELNTLRANWHRDEYKRKRWFEYPDPIDLIDGFVKGDKAQMDKYLEKCHAVKAKYPKPE